MQQIMLTFVVFLCICSQLVDTKGFQRYEKIGKISCLYINNDVRSQVINYWDTTFCTFSIKLFYENCTSEVEFGEISENLTDINDKILPLSNKNISKLWGVYDNDICNFYTKDSLALDGSQEQFKTLFEACLKLKKKKNDKCKEKFIKHAESAHFGRTKKLWPNTIKALLGKPVSNIASAVNMAMSSLLILFSIAVIYY